MKARSQIPSTFRLGPGQPRFSAWGVIAASVLNVLLVLTAGQGAEPASPPTPFRFGFSSNMLSNVSHKDAKAAVKVWAQTVAKERKIPADPEPDILDGVDAIAARMRAQTLDTVALSLAEYRDLSQRQPLSDLFIAVQQGRTNLEYLLLVHRDSPLTTLAELAGKNLTCYENPRTSLALTWLDVLLVEHGSRPAAGYFNRVVRNPKLSAAVLPVFFRQNDACVVDDQGFETLCELNPQVGKQLRRIAVSPPLVPMLFCMRADYTPAIKGRILEALVQLHTTPAGQQVLTVLQIERMQRADPSCLQSGLDLLTSHDRLCGRTNEVAKGIQISAHHAGRETQQ